MNKEFLYLHTMKGLYLLLIASSIAVVSVSCNTSHDPPKEQASISVPTINQMPTEQMAQVYTLTNYADVQIPFAVENPVHFAINNLKGTQSHKFVYKSQTYKSSAFVDTSTSKILANHQTITDRRSIPELNFQYTEGRATEYMC